MFRGGLSAALGVLLACRAAFPAESGPLSLADREQLAVYARDTWKSLDALASVGVLPADNLFRSEEGWRHAEYTSPTNIAAYLWSTLAAENLRLISRDESGARLGRTLDALGRIERAHGFFYNWYDPRSGDRLKAWPGGGRVRPFLSSVDNGWLAAALMMVANSRPELRAPAEAILGPMNFGFFYDAFDPADPVGHPGLLRGGYFPEENAYTKYHYGMLNTEPRIASYVGITRGHLPPDHYYRMKRAEGVSGSPSHLYHGVPVQQGSRSYRNMRLLPTWDGTMFEALMVPLFVPESTWAEASWGKNHATYARAQIEYGLNDARLGYWGVSASSDPDGGYHAYGVAPLAARARPKGAHGIVTPHASFLALAFAPRQAMDNLIALAAGFPVYGEYGFLDSVDVRQGRVSGYVLALDQGMVLAAVANLLGENVLQNAFSSGAVESVIRPLIAPESFSFDSEEIASRSSIGERATKRSDPPRPDGPLPILGSPAILQDSTNLFKGNRRRRSNAARGASSPPSESVP